MRARTAPMLAALWLLAAAGGSAAAEAAGHPYFPLAVGSRWAFRCSTEGVSTPGKVLQITGQLRHEGRAYFRATLAVGKDPVPLVQYFSVGADGGLRRTLAVGPDDAEVLLAADTGPGTPHGSWVSAGTERLSVPALPRAQALRIETFSIDAPEVPADRRAEWRARYYVKGVGPVADANGLGGRCELTGYRRGLVRTAR